MAVNKKAQIAVAGTLALALMSAGEGVMTLETQADFVEKNSREVFDLTSQSSRPELARQAETWKTNLSQIIRETGKDHGFYLLPFTADTTTGLLNTAYKQAISFIPARASTAQLVVDGSHGCIALDVAKSNKDNADMARSLLLAFTAGKGELGTYTVNDGKPVSFSPKGNAANFCVKAPPILG
ncbi:MAG TPA: hypothetical protein VIF12_06380 [Micavibrio sp.]